MSKQTVIKWWLSITVILIISMVASSYYDSVLLFSGTSAIALVSFGGVMTYTMITENVKPTPIETKSNKLHLLSIEGSIIYVSTSPKALLKTMESITPDIIARGGVVEDVAISTLLVELPLVPNNQSITYNTK